MQPNARWIYLVLLVIASAAPLLGIYPVFMMKALCFALFACAFNLLLGYVGLLSLGHAAFFGSAGYAFGHAVKAWSITPEFGLLLGTVVGAVLGLIIGGLAIRRSGIYFAMITLALSQLVYFGLLQSSFTGGEDGLQGIPRGRLFGMIDLQNDLVLFYVTLVVFCVGFGVIYRTIRSPFGQVLRAIRDNEPRMISLGYDVNRYKLIAFVISSALCGLAGALKTLVLGFETLTDVHWHLSGEVVLMTLLGGMGTVLGPVTGALTIVTLQNELADRAGSWVTVVMGVIFVACVLIFRRGIVGELSAGWKRLVTPAAHPADPVVADWTIVTPR